MISSQSNQQMKNLSALIKKTKERKNQGCFVAEGPKMCLEAPREWVKAVYVSQSFFNNPENQARLPEEYEVVADNVF